MILSYFVEGIENFYCLIGKTIDLRQLIFQKCQSLKKYNELYKQIKSEESDFYRNVGR